MPGGLDRWRKVGDLHSQNGLWAISKWQNFEIINFIQIFPPTHKVATVEVTASISPPKRRKPAICTEATLSTAWPSPKWPGCTRHQSVASPLFAAKRHFAEPDHRRNDQAPPATKVSPARYLQRSDTLRSLTIAEMTRLHPPPKRRQPAICSEATLCGAWSSPKWSGSTRHPSVASPLFAAKRHFEEPDHLRSNQAPPTTKASPARYLQWSDAFRNLIIAEMTRLHPPPKRRQPAICSEATLCGGLIIAEMIRLHPPPKRRQPAICSEATLWGHFADGVWMAGWFLDGCETSPQRGPPWVGGSGASYRGGGILEEILSAIWSRLRKFDHFPANLITSPQFWSLPRNFDHLPANLLFVARMTFVEDFWQILANRDRPKSADSLLMYRTAHSAHI